MGVDDFKHIVYEEILFNQKFEIYNTFEEPNISEKVIIENDFELTDKERKRLYSFEKEKTKEELKEKITKKEENIANKDNDKTSSTSKKHISNNLELIKKNEKIFDITKYKVHDKFGQDNILRKIKRAFIKSLIDYINKIYGEYQRRNNHKNIKKLLKRISPKTVTEIKKQNNLKWLNSTIKDILSKEISTKYKDNNGFYNYNEKQINKLFKDGKAKDVIDILEKTVRDLYNIFINKEDNNETLEGFETLEDNIQNIREKMKKEGKFDIESYLYKYRTTAKNFEKIFSEMRIRRIVINNKFL